MGNFQQNRPRVQGSWVRGLLVQNIPWLVIVKVLYMRHLLEVFIYAILPSPRRARLSTRPRVQGMGGGVATVGEGPPLPRASALLYFSQAWS